MPRWLGLSEMPEQTGHVPDVCALVQPEGELTYVTPVTPVTSVTPVTMFVLLCSQKAK